MCLLQFWACAYASVSFFHFFFSMFPNWCFFVLLCCQLLLCSTANMHKSKIGFINVKTCVWWTIRNAVGLLNNLIHSKAVRLLDNLTLTSSGFTLKDSRSIWQFDTERQWVCCTIWHPDRQWVCWTIWYSERQWIYCTIWYCER